MKDTQSRKYLLTLNNPQDHNLDHDEIKRRLDSLKSLRYYCMADEIGLETGTPHTHVFILCSSVVRFSRIKKLFPEAHIDQSLGTAQQNRDYVAKQEKWAEDPKSDTSVAGTFEESGELPEEPGQGARTDIAEIYTLIQEGYSNAEIMAKNPDFAGRITYMDKIRQEILTEKYRTTFRQVSVTYIWGPTETGKTRGVMETEGYENVYRVTDYQHPFDGYANQPVLLLDEFRSSLTLGDMLNYLDGYPLALPARYANRQACYERVYMISNIDLKKQYFQAQNSEPATWRAFLRRIHKVVEYRKDGTHIDHGPALYYIFPEERPVPDWVKEAENAPEIGPSEPVQLNMDDDIPF